MLFIATRSTVSICTVADAQHAKFHTHTHTQQSPAEFNTWILFRVLVDVVLFTDVTTYFAFVIRYIEVPGEFTFAVFLCYLVCNCADAVPCLVVAHAL
jgi:hypothetical protein